MNPAGPILDYRPPRPKRQRIARRQYGMILRFGLLLSPVLLAQVYVMLSLARYSSSGAPFPRAALIVSIAALGGAIGLGLALRG